MKQTIKFTIEIDVDAETAARLPGYPGTGSPGTAYGDVDLPVSGLEIECSIIADEIARKAKELLPEKLRPQVMVRHFEVGRQLQPVW